MLPKWGCSLFLTLNLSVWPFNCVLKLLKRVLPTQLRARNGGRGEREREIEREKDFEVMMNTRLGEKSSSQQSDEWIPPAHISSTANINITFTLDPTVSRWAHAENAIVHSLYMKMPLRASKIIFSFHTFYALRGCVLTQDCACVRVAICFNKVF